MSVYPTKDQAKLVVVRHGETEWSKQGRHTGRTDIALDASGREAAIALKSHLVQMSFVLVMSSPLSRAIETSALAGFGAETKQTPDLSEWDYGAYEGRRTLDIRKERPGWSLWSDGVPGGETAEQVGSRVDRVIALARGAGGDVLCFAHAHVLRVLAARWVGLGPQDGSILVLDACALGELGWERELPVIRRWNVRW
ncbi:MAG: histidine phosphatase family protein [Acidimicrobiales bacterium]